MNLLEHQGKAQLAEAGIPVPRGAVARTAGAASGVATEIGRRVALKSQVPSGKRGRSGGIAFADTPAEAEAAARDLLGQRVGGYAVGELLVEQCADIRSEYYLAVLNDPASKGPLVLLSAAGGMDIEEVGAAAPEEIRRQPVDIRIGLSETLARSLASGLDLSRSAREQLVDIVLRAYRLYRDLDATLVEINPLVVTGQDRVVALDSKISLDPGALPRHAELVEGLTSAAVPEGTELERRGRESGLPFMELGGSVGVLANGAGLTMTTLDAVAHYGGEPANFLEIGGDAYTKATAALRLVLDNPRVRSLLVNFCGAFARTDVMTDGVVTALEQLRPRVPVFFTVHGTGEAEATRLLRERLGAEPYDLMDDAVRAAVEAAGSRNGKVAH